jgi:replicative DNA helicase
MSKQQATDRIIAQTPPHDLRSEQAVIGAVIGNYKPEAIDLLKPADFYAPQHVELWRTLKAMHEAGDPIDWVSLATKLQQAGKLEEASGSAYLAQLAECATDGANAGWFADVVREHSQRRKIIDACLAASTEA